MSPIDSIALTFWEIPFIPTLLILWAVGCSLKGAICAARGKSRWLAAINIVACLAGITLLERTPGSIISSEARTEMDRIANALKDRDHYSIASWLRNLDTHKWIIPPPKEPDPIRE